jgi:hypothetical protein
VTIQQRRLRMETIYSIRSLETAQQPHAALPSLRWGDRTCSVSFGSMCVVRFTVNAF